MNHKRIPATALALILAASLTACGGNGAEGETSSAPAVTSETTSEAVSETTTPDTSDTTTSAVESDDGQDTTTSSSAKSANSSTGKTSSSSSSKPSASSKSSGSKSSGSIASKSQSNKNTTSKKPDSKPADKPAQTQPMQSGWTQAEVNNLVAEIKAYAQSKGFSINTSLTTQGTSWSNPIHTGKDKSKTKSDLKADVDFIRDLVIQDFGYVPDSAALNVLALSCGTNEWEIYIVY